jgi:3-oxoadipate enol-lactonase
MALIRIGEETFNVVVDGPAEAPALMLSNSLGTTLDMWEPQLPELTRHFRVIRYDARGHGKSVVTPGPYSIEQLARDALAILDALEIASAHWVGLSLGGMIGQWLVTHAPQRIGRAVLANTGAQMGRPDLWNMRVRTAREKGMEALVESIVARWFTPGFQKTQVETVARISAMVKATPAEGYAATCSAIRDMDQRESIRRASRPVLVIVGAQDPATPPAMGQLIARSIPGGKLATVDAAHLSNVEQPLTFTRAVVDFLSAKSPRRKTPTKAAAKKAAAKKSPSKKPAAKKSAAKKAAGKKHAVKKHAAKKHASKKQAAKKGPAKKAAAKKSAAKKAATRKRTRR